MSENFNLNDLVAQAKAQNKKNKGLIIEKKKEEEKKPIGSLSTEVSKNIDARINEQDELIKLAQENPEDPKIRAMKQSMLFRQTGHVPTLEEIKIATGTDEASKNRQKQEKENNINNKTNVDLSGETNDLLQGKTVMTTTEFKNQHPELFEKKNEPEVTNNVASEENKTETNHKTPVPPEVVVIEKSVPGDLNFSEEEKEKLVKADYIELREIDTLEIPTKVVKVERGTIGSLIEKKIRRFTTEMTMFVSGYVATIKALTPGDILDIVYPTGEDTVQQSLFRWSKIYNAVESTSIGKMSFDQFCHNTSELDYNLFLLAILIATYSTEKQSIEIICRQDTHGKDGYRFKEEINYKELMRVDMLDDRALELIVNAAEASKTIESAKEWHQHAPLLTRKYYKLPSGIIFAVQLESVYDSINNHYNSIEEKVKESRINARFALIAKYIPRLYVPDEETGETILLEDIRDIIEYMRTMSPDDMEIINNKVIESVEGLDVKFGIKDVVCPSCGDKTEIVEINLENELFTKASQSNPKKYV
jgi:hypothetical protein